MSSPLHHGSARLLVAALFLAACAAPPTRSPPPAAITIVDSQGRTVQLAAPPQRIVVAGKSTLPLLDALYLFPEARERVAGWVTGRQKPETFLQFVDPTADEKATLAVEAGPEQVSALRPDVVIVRSLMADNLGRGLLQLGIPVVYLDMETPDQYMRGIDLIGQLLGNAARAENIRGYYESRLDRIVEALAGLEAAARPRILILQHTATGGSVALQVPPVAYLQTTMAELAAAAPVWKDMAGGSGWQVVNLEQIFAWNPDQIYIVSYETDSAQRAAQLRSDPQWQDLKAVREGRIYGFPADGFSWDQPDPRWILGQVWLAKRVHPDRFRDWDIQQEISVFFSEMYGMDATSVRHDIVPLLKGDLQ